MLREAPPDADGARHRTASACAWRARRAPTELQVLVAEFLRERDYFATERRAGREMLGEAAARIPDAEVPELAAWTVVASVLLNLDEFITKE